MAKPKKIVLISCVKQKRHTSAKAEDMYLSPLFKKSLMFARSLNADDIYILSAKYELLPLNEIIETYDETINTKTASERRCWAANVISQLRAKCSLKSTKIIILAGKKYYEYLIGEGKIELYTLPLKGKKIGERLQFLNEGIKKNANQS